MTAEPLSPSDILPFVAHIERLRQEGWTVTMCMMYDFSEWHVVFCHEATRKARVAPACYAHGLHVSLREAMKQAIASAMSDKWELA